MEKTKNQEYQLKLALEKVQSIYHDVEFLYNCIDSIRGDIDCDEIRGCELCPFGENGKKLCNYDTDDIITELSKAKKILEEFEKDE